jgi:dTDP-4-dehydrorhamnose reductase
MLVTGGSGYLGGWVARLARADWGVVATYLAHPVQERSADWRRLDVTDGPAVDALVAEVQPAVIVHTAAANPGAGTDFQTTNVAGTGHVARAAARLGSRLIHISTDVVFDGEKGNYTEEDLPAPIAPYGHSKALAEREVAASGAEAVIVRTSLVYGWRPRIDRHTRWVLDDLSRGKPVRLFADELRCPIWVESLAAALVELAGLDTTGVLHVAGEQVLSRYEFGVRLLRFHDVDSSAIVAARSRGSGLQRPADCTLDCSRARDLLCTPLPGLDEVLQQARDHGTIST